MFFFHLLTHTIRQRWRRLGPLSPPLSGTNVNSLTTPLAKKSSTSVGPTCEGVAEDVHCKSGQVGAGTLVWGGMGQATAETRRGVEKVRERLALLVRGCCVRALFSGFVVGLGPIITLKVSPPAL